MPSLTWRLGADPSEAQWAIDAYTIALAASCCPRGGSASASAAARSSVLGLTLFALASLAGSQAGAVGPLIAARTAMGVGRGADHAVGAVAPRRPVPGPAGAGPRGRRVVGGHRRRRGGRPGGRRLGAGELLVGSILLVNVPICLIALVIVPILVPASRNPDIGALDPLGAALVIAALTGLGWAIIEGPARGWTDPVLLGVAGAAAAALLGLALRARAAQGRWWTSGCCTARGSPPR